MRRQDREVENMKDIITLLSQGEVVNLAFYHDPYPYVIPVNYGLGSDEEGLCLYFHGAVQGQKIACMEQDDRVGFCVVCAYEPVILEPACKTTAHYSSVCGGGRMMPVTEPEEKHKALTAIMAQCSRQDHFLFTPDVVNRTAVFKIAVEEIHGKSNRE